jgi:hypothetical protein
MNEENWKQKATEVINYSILQFPKKQMKLTFKEEKLIIFN